MNKIDSKKSNILWLFSFIIVSVIGMFTERYYYGLKDNYCRLILIDIVYIVVFIVCIAIPLIFDFYNSKNNNLSIKNYYLELDGENDIIRLFFILTLLGYIYNLLQDMYHLKLIDKITDYNLFGIFLIVLVMYLKYLALKIKRVRWNALDSNIENVSWKYLIQNNNFDHYKGEVILSIILRKLNLEDIEIKASANNNFDYYKIFVEKLQSLSNQELIELYNYLNMKNRDSYKWSIKKIMSANLGKVCLSIVISLLSFSSIVSIVQLCSSIKKEMILNGMISLLNYFIFFYILLFLFFYLLQILIYSLFISYQRRIRNKNIEAFLLSTLQSVLDIKLSNNI